MWEKVLILVIVGVIVVFSIMIIVFGIIKNKIKYEDRIKKSNNK